MHRAAAGVEAQAMDEDPMERLRLPHEPRFERRVVEPGAYDFATLTTEGQREVPLEEGGIGPISGEVEVRHTRVHPGVEYAVLAHELTGSTLRALRERCGVLPRPVVLPGRRRERFAALLAVPKRDLRVIEPTPRDRPVDRQALHPIEEQLPMPRRSELHLVSEAFQVLPEFKLFQIPRVRRDELDWVQRSRTNRRLVLDRFNLVQGAANPPFVDRLLPGRVDFQALQETGRFRHSSRLVDRLEWFQTQLAEHCEVDHVSIRADHRGPAAELGFRT